MTASTKANAHITGSLHSRNGKGMVRMNGHYDTDIDDLWQAITDPRRLARWLAEVDGDLRIGGEIRAKFTSGWTGSGRIDICEPPHHLVVSMSSDEGDETIVAAELCSDGDGTRLIVEERGISFDELAAHGAGWQAHVEDLAAHLLLQDRCDLATRWAEVVPSYRALTPTPD